MSRRTRYRPIRRRPQPARWRWALLAGLCAGAIGGWLYGHSRPPAQPSTAWIHASVHTLPATRVLVVGGSVARGWGDQTGPGYIVRAFAALPGQHPYVITNAAIPGTGPEQVQAQFRQELDKVRPNVVVLSWGTLNDVYRRTPLNVFERAIEQEIAESLRHRAVVLVITPPVTQATYTRYSASEPQYVARELAAAAEFHNPNVYVFDVFDDMEQYLAAHHQDYARYAADGWHPNAAGHILAARLLAAGMEDVFAGGVIRYRHQAEVADHSAAGQHSHMVQ
ncbi:MAG: SGNH/GDSL hydrolase family protein [Alicyclobacillaceae bacterium]|nr:SGNH/GDSL hydrolase family protein [Alicyclobacillaceae bacterium]